MKRWRRDAFTKLSDAGSTTLTSRDALGLGVVLIVAAALRVAFIDQSLWFDEYASVFFASQPLSRLWSTWMVRETNPPLFYSVLHIWIDSARRIDAVWLRVIPIAANLATVTVVFNEVRRLYGTRTGLIAASLLAVSAQHIAYALQVRAYSMMGLALAVSFFGLMRVVAARDREGRPSGAWAMYVAGALAAIYLHTTAVLWPLIASLSLIVVDRRFVPLRGAAWRTLAAADLLILLGASWWLYVTYLQIASPNGNLAWMMAADLRTSISVFARSIFLVREIYGVQLAMPVMLLGLAVLGIVRTWTSPATRLTMVCLALSAIVYLVANLKQPIVVERAIVWMSVFPVVLVAAGIGSLRWRTAVVALTGLALMLPIVNLMKNRSFEHENWVPVMAALSNDPAAVVVADGEGLGLATETACRVETAGRNCPFAVVTIAGPAQIYNGWARGYAPRVAAGADGRPSISPTAHLYFIQRWESRAYDEFVRAGLSTPPAVAAAIRTEPAGRPAFLVGRSAAKPSIPSARA